MNGNIEGKRMNIEDVIIEEEKSFRDEKIVIGRKKSIGGVIDIEKGNDGKKVIEMKKRMGEELINVNNEVVVGKF